MSLTHRANADEADMGMTYDELVRPYTTTMLLSNPRPRLTPRDRQPLADYAKSTSSARTACSRPSYTNGAPTKRVNRTMTRQYTNRIRSRRK
jgi:hypothetical protein